MSFTEQDRKPEVKIAIVGDGFVGKSCLVAAFLQKEFLSISPPTAFETHWKDIIVDGVEYTLSILDTGGLQLEGRCAANREYFLGIDCFIICFALNKEASYHNVVETWKDRVNELCPTADILLVGTKVDLRRSTPTAILHFQGIKLMRTIKARAYLECSAKNQIGVTEVFHEALRAGTSRSNPVDTSKEAGKCCCSLT